MTTRNSGLCFNCLNKDHRIVNCPSKKNCQHNDCNKRHNTLLHRDFQIAGYSSHLTGRQGFRTNNRNHPPETSHNKSPSQKEKTASVNVTQKDSTNNCLQKKTEVENYRTETHQPAANLQILPINLHNQHRSTAVYALLDSGSTSSFLTKNIAEKLKFTPETTTTLKIKGFNATQTINSTVVDLQISDIENRETHKWRNVYEVDNDQLPTVKEHPKQIADNSGHLRDIQLPQLNNLNLEALLGCDIYALIIAREIREGNTEQPIAVRSRLGWTVAGPNQHFTPTNDVYFCQTCESHDQQLFEDVKMWWNVESYGPRAATEDPTTNEEDKAPEILADTCRKTDDGRFETGLSWKSTEEQPNNRVYAENHLMSLQRKLKDDDLAQPYRKEIQKDLDKGYIKEINGEQEEDNTKWFLPHYGRVSAAKLGKFRRIANAADVFNGKCLNNHLLPGPDLLNDLVGIILRSREKPIIITADIEGFIKQVGVRKEDRKFLRFLWNDDFNKPPKEFEYQRHTFGARDSPACAIYALQQAARDNAQNYPDVLETVTTDFYMDDFVKSVGSTEEALQLHQRLRHVLGSHSFNLIKWCSNSRAFCNELHESLSTNEKNEIFTKNNRQKVLGVSWFPLTDMFAAHINKHNPDMLQKWTQRKLLGLFSRIFDWE